MACKPSARGPYPDALNVLDCFGVLTSCYTHFHPRHPTKEYSWVQRSKNLKSLFHIVDPAPDMLNSDCKYIKGNAKSEHTAHLDQDGKAPPVAEKLEGTP